MMLDPVGLFATTVFIAIVADYVGDAGRAIIIDPFIRRIRDLRHEFGELADEAINDLLKHPYDETKRKIASNILETNLAKNSDLAVKIGNFNRDVQVDLERQLAIAKRNEDYYNECIIMMKLGDIYRECRNDSKSLEMYTEVFETCRNMGDPKEAQKFEAQAIANIGTVYDRKNEYENAIKMYEKAQLLFSDLGLQTKEAQMLKNAGDIFLKKARYNSAINKYENAANIYHALKDPREIEFLMSIGICLGKLTHWDLSIGKYKEGLHTVYKLEENNDGGGTYTNYIKALIMSNMAVSYSNLEQFSEALNLCKSSLPLIRELGDKHDLIKILYNIGNLSCSLSNGNQGNYWEMALSSYSECLSLLRDVESREREAEVLLNIGYIHSNKNSRNEAIKFFENSMKIFYELDNKFGVGLCHMDIADVYLKEGKREIGVKYLKMALENLPPESSQSAKIKEFLNKEGDSNA